jgi:hypothetical protein
MAQFVELDVDQGTDVNFDLNLTNDDGTSINIADYSFSSTIRKSFYSLNPTANMTVTIINAANGNVALSLNAATTANIKAGRYVFDVKQVDNVNTISRVFEGIITVNPQVTK